MTSQHDKAKRWRPRFSVRTLVIVVTLVCCYAACWGPTNRRGKGDVRYAPRPDGREGNHGVATFAIAPLFIRREEPYTRERSYYFWFFGYVAKLPYEREL